MAKLKSAKNFAVGINASSATKITIIGGTITGAANSAIMTGVGVQELEISNANIINNNGVGIIFSGKKMAVHGSTITAIIIVVSILTVAPRRLILEPLQPLVTIPLRLIIQKVSFRVLL